jgi:hypothetical protein
MLQEMSEFIIVTVRIMLQKIMLLRYRYNDVQRIEKI